MLALLSKSFLWCRRADALSIKLWRAKHIASTAHTPGKLQYSHPLKNSQQNSFLAMSTKDSASSMPQKKTDTATISPLASAAISQIEERIGRDEGGRGMRCLVVPGDLHRAAETLARLGEKKHVVVLSGFPCRVDDDPPTETDGPPGTLAIARAVVGLGHSATIVTDECNEKVFRAACRDIGAWAESSVASPPPLVLEAYPSEEQMTEDDRTRMNRLAIRNGGCDLVIACERAGPAEDGHCYTMGGIDMNVKGLIAPLHEIVEQPSASEEKDENSVQFIGVGDGGNELGMGKVVDLVRNNIRNGRKIAAVTPADCLVAASVSNWGGYALGAAAAIVRYDDQVNGRQDVDANASMDLKGWIEQCVPTEQDEIELLDRCVKAGCRDGVSGKVESTVDGMPLETSMKCLRDIRLAALGMESS
uniref:D-glutamate cyclase-like C-terminal domain-containing protein n=1 Tax=Helicotheca tamesis TaxID=374047 RepID=A0A7S2HNH4_9STRA